MLPSHHITRIHTPIDEFTGTKLRWANVDQLGLGAFGEVDSGRYMAVKKIVRSEVGFEDRMWLTLKREVETQARVKHVCHHPFKLCLFR